MDTRFGRYSGHKLYSGLDQNDQSQKLNELELPASFSELVGHLSDALRGESNGVPTETLCRVARLELKTAGLDLETAFIHRVGTGEGSRPIVTNVTMATDQHGDGAKLTWSKFRKHRPAIVEGLQSKYPRLEKGLVLEIRHENRGQEVPSYFVAVCVAREGGSGLELKLYRERDLITNGVAEKHAKNGHKNSQSSQESAQA